MSIRVQCPGCEKKLKAKDELAGKRVKCPGRGQVLEVPRASAASLRTRQTTPLTRKSSSEGLTGRDTAREHRDSVRSPDRPSSATA
jgi:hypothetical protein